MSSTNKTSHYELSQFIGTDKPAWLTDYNSDMLKIDTGLAAAAAEASGAQGTATSAASAAQAAQNTANQAVTSATANAEDLTELKGALTNTVDIGSRLGNIQNGQMYLGYSDYITSFRINNISWSDKPNNSTLYNSYYRVPITQLSGNIYKITASTLSDDNSKVYVGNYSINYTTSSENLTDGIVVSAYFDGANTIYYLNFSKTLYESITVINRIWGNGTVLFSGNFISLDE